MPVRRLFSVPYRWVVLIGLLGVLLSVQVYQITREQEQSRLQSHFDHLAHDRVLRLQGTIDQYLEVLNAVGLFLNASQEVSRAEFGRMAAPLSARHVGIMAINWAPRVRHEERLAHESRVKAEGYAPDGIYDVDAKAYYLGRAPERAEYFPILYVEPLARNGMVIGLDPYARPVHTQAMVAAARAGRAWSSAPFPVLQDPGGALAVAVFQPVYWPDRPLATGTERHRALRGFVILLLRLNEVFAGGLADAAPVGLDIRLLDETNRLQVVHQHRARLEPASIRPGETLSSRLSMSMPGRKWVAVLTATESFHQRAGSRQAPLALGAGLGITALVCLLLYGIARQDQQRSRLLENIRASELRLRQTFETNTAIKLIIDPNDGRILEANSAAEAFYGYDRNALLEMKISDINILPEEEIQAEMARAVAAQRMYFSFRHRQASGEVRDVEVYSGPIETAEGRQLYSIIHDVTDRKRTEADLRESEMRFRQLAENIDSAFWVISPDWRQVHYISPAYERIWGRSAEKLYRDSMDWFDAVLAEDRPALQALLPPEHGPTWQHLEFPPYRIRRPDGDIRWIASRAFAIADETGRITRVAGISEDITERQEHEQHLEHQAHYDALTNLPNRLLLVDRMRQALARSHRTGQLLAICMLDLDGFKEVNDQLGHKAGDQLLVKVASRLGKGVRGDDTVARLGGDEFVLLLGGVGNLTEAEETLERLLALIALPYDINDQQVVISASIGVTIYPSDRGDADTLLRHADHTMYLAKQAGKNRFHLFNPILEKRERENQQTLRLIARAVEKGELRLHYQPIVDSREGRVIAMEALLRWQHPVLGLLSPAEFLPLVESDVGLTQQVGNWVLRAALEQLRAWRQAGHDISVSINVFVQHLRDPDFPNLLESLLAEFADVPADRLTLEILETAALEDMGGVIQLIEFSARLGMRYALDDFGTGYSSLTYLRRLPVHALKIDQSFIRDMLQDPEDMSIVEGIIGLATAFRHRVVAEGVETADHALMLLEMGCHLVQGYGIARPMPAEMTLDWLRGFQPDPRWLAKASKRLARDDHQLVLAEVYHRQWLAHLLSWGRDDNANGNAPPPQDSHSCNFGRWYDTDGKQRYGHLQHFTAAGPIHERLHALAEKYVRRVESADVDAAQHLEAEILQQRALLLDALSKLRAEVMFRDLGQ